MKQIKTAEEALDEQGVRIFGAQEERIKAAMRAYAEQFIDAAAEEILVDDSDDTNMKAILKLKEHLK